jgi:hypothetical protein
LHVDVLTDLQQVKSDANWPFLETLGDVRCRASVSKILLQVYSAQVFLKCASRLNCYQTYCEGFVLAAEALEQALKTNAKFAKFVASVYDQATKTRNQVRFIMFSTDWLTVSR